MMKFLDLAYNDHKGASKNLVGLFNYPLGVC